MIGFLFFISSVISILVLYMVVSYMGATHQGLFVFLAIVLACLVAVIVKNEGDERG